MKKFTVLMLLVSLIVPAALAQKFDNVKTRPSTTVTTQLVKNSVKMLPATREAVPEGYASVTLTAGDVWGDGSGYQMLLDADATAYGSIIPETGGLTTSGDATDATYAEFEYKIPENADGAMTTQNVVLSNSVTILIPAGTYDWCITNPTPNDRIWIASSNGSVGGRADDFQFVSGATYIFTVSLGGQNDQVDLEEVVPGTATIPTDLTADPGATYANMTWVPGENNETYVLRYRPYVDPSLQNRLINLDGTDEEVDAQLEDIYIYDADGDGNNWALDQDANGGYCFTSASYSGGALTPDNWMFLPETELGGSISFDTWNYNASWPEIFSVYVYEGDDWSIDNEDLIAGFVPVAENVTVTGTSSAMQHVEYDLSAFEGKGRIAIRHFGTTDMWRFYIDNVEITIPNPVEVPEWIEVTISGEPAYMIEGLTPETEYEAQVMAYNDINETAWTESTHFTTLAEDPVQGITELYMVGTFNDWNQSEDGGRLQLVEVEEGVFEVEAELAADAEFKLITPDETNPTGWKWFGGADDNQVGYFLITEELYDAPISLIDGANFHMQNAGKFIFRVRQARSVVEPLVLEVVPSNPTAIVDLNTKTQDNTWYNIQGMKLQGVPTAAGIYINGGKKVVIK